MAGYIGSKASVVSSGAERKKTFAITTTTTVLTGLSYTPTFVHLFHNGVRLVDGTDYTATDGTSITLTSAAESGDEVVVISYASFQVADAYTKAEADAGFVSDPNGAVTVDGSGNVGIGATPTGSLDVARSGSHEVVFRTTTTGDPTINLQADGQNNGKISYVRATEGLTFSNSGAERMRIDSAGRVTMPYQPAFDVSYSGSVYTTLGTVVFDTVYTNVGGHYNTSNGRFTAPVSGSYIFYTSHIKGNAPANVARRRFDRNSSEASNGRHLRLDEGQNFGDNGVLQSIIYCNAGDYVTVNQFVGSSYGTHEYDYFGGYLIG